MRRNIRPPGNGGNGLCWLLTVLAVAVLAEVQAGGCAPACRLAGCPGRIPHDLRRTAVRNFVRAEVSEHVAMKLSGHKTASMFRRYDMVSDGELIDAVEKLQAASAK